MLAVRDTPYTELRVVEHQGRRYLLLDGGTHSFVRRRGQRDPAGLVMVTELATELFARPGRALIVGLGAGCLARQLTMDNWRVDAVEIDPEVTRAAREFFRFQPQFATVHHADGRRFLQATRDTFDLIVLDAFGSGSVPFHLLTAEAFAEARAKLRPGGVIAVNLEARRLAGAAGARGGRHARHLLRARHRAAHRRTAGPARQRRALRVRPRAGDRRRAARRPGHHAVRRAGALAGPAAHARLGQPLHPHRRTRADRQRNPSDLRSEEINLATRRKTRALLPASLLAA